MMTVQATTGGATGNQESATWRSSDPVDDRTGAGSFAVESAQEDVPTKLHPIIQSAVDVHTSSIGKLLRTSGEVISNLVEKQIDLVTGSLNQLAVDEVSKMEAYFKLLQIDEDSTKSDAHDLTVAKLQREFDEY